MNDFVKGARVRLSAEGRELRGNRVTRLSELPAILAREGTVLSARPYRPLGYHSELVDTVRVSWDGKVASEPWRTRSLELVP